MVFAFFLLSLTYRTHRRYTTLTYLAVLTALTYQLHWSHLPHLFHFHLPFLTTLHSSVTHAITRYLPVSEADLQHILDQHTSNNYHKYLLPEMKHLLAWAIEHRDKVGFRHPKEGHSDPHRADPHLPPSAPLLGWPTLLPHDIGFHTALEGEFKRSVLGEYSRQREGTRVKTANVRRYSSL